MPSEPSPLPFAHSSSCFLCRLSPCAHSISPFVSFFLAYSLHFCLRETLAHYIVCFTMKFWAITSLSSVATFFSDAKCWFFFFFVNHYGLFLPFSYIFWLGPMLVQFWLLASGGYFQKDKVSGGRVGGEPKMLYQHPQNWRSSDGVLSEIGV